MFCSKCGKELPEGVQICEKCNNSEPEKIIIDVKENSAIPLSQQTCAETVAVPSEEQPSIVTAEVAKKRKPPVKKKKKGKIILLVFIILAVLVLGIIAFPYAKNAVMKATLSQKEYFSYVVEKHAEDAAENVTMLFKADNPESENTAYGGNMKLNLEGKGSRFFECFYHEFGWIFG